jgi:hypothetical protein
LIQLLRSRNPGVACLPRVRFEAKQPWALRYIPFGEKRRMDRPLTLLGTMRITICLLFLALPTLAADPCISGIPIGKRPGPYSFLVASGPERGRQTCYVCETAEKPAAIVFARKVSEPLGKLLSKFDEAVGTHKEGMRSWMTILGEKAISLDDLAKWSKEVGLKQVPLGVFDDPAGPPSYKLHEDAEVTVLLFVKEKVIANYAFRANELNDSAIEKIVKELPKLIQKK